MAWVRRKLECGLGHTWHALVEKGAPPPDECPVCEAIVAGQVTIADPPHAPARARSDNQPAPGIRGPATKAVARFEKKNFVDPHFDDGSPLMTNLKDNVREGESHAIRETVDTNQTMAMTAEMLHHAELEKKRARDTEGAHTMLPMGGGWQGAHPAIIQAAGGPQGLMDRPGVDLQTKKRA
jgi:hypothetical protein